MTRLRFYVGTQDATGRSVTHAPARTYLMKRFGGYTAFHGQGGWRDAADNWLREPTTVYEILGEVRNPAEVALALRDLCRQQSVLYTAETVEGGFV